MKKTIALLLALVLCLSLCACGGGNDNPTTEAPTATTTSPTTTPSTPETTAPAETEPQYTTVEITLENWQEYFEIREEIEVDYNDFGEVVDGIFNQYCYNFCLKDAYISRLVAANVAVEYSASGKAPYWFEHNNDTKEATLGALCTEQEMKDRNFGIIDPDEIKTGTNTFTERDITMLLLSAGQWRGLETSDNITRWVGAVYQNFEITRIQGTITITE